jgi:hypothetical protein
VIGPTRQRFGQGLGVLLLPLVAAASAPAQGLAPAPDASPPPGGFRLGSLYVSPTLALRQMGLDSNVFNDPDDPQEDFVISALPEVNLYLRPSYMQLSGTFGADFNYFHTYSSERYVAPVARGRADFLFNRLRPFVSGSRIDTRDRPNREIDARARHADYEGGGGVGFEISPLTLVYASTTRSGTTYRDGESFDDVALDESLNRQTTAYDAGIRLELTPLTTLAIVGSFSDDRFSGDPTRDSDSTTVSAEFTFDPDAIFSGRARLGVRGFRPVDPALESFTGLVASASIAWPILDRGRLVAAVLRDVQYSFEQTEGYYIETTTDFTYTHRLAGAFDVQGRGAWSRLGYAEDQAGDARVDRVSLASAGVGYNLGSSRLGLTYEWSRRSSDLRADRQYERTRLFASWNYTF